MAYRNLDEYLTRLEQAGELTRITTSVSPDLEISVMTDNAAKRPPLQNKALWFEQVEGSAFPVVTNLFGTERRMAWALGAENLGALEERMAQLVNPLMPQGLGGMMNRAAELMSVLRSSGIGVRPATKAEVQEVICDVDLSIFPSIRLWEMEKTPTLALAQILIQINGSRQTALGRVQILDSQTLGLPAALLTGYSTSDSKLPAAVVLGGDPAAMWCASAPLPAGIDAYLLAGWLRKRAVKLAKAISQPLDIPAEAEFIIEGWVDPTDVRSSGAISSDSGYYVSDSQLVAMHVTAITHRRDAILPISIPGRPPTDHLWMNKAIERLFMPLLRLLFEEVFDLNLPAAGVSRNLAIVSIKSHALGAAQKVMFGLWGMGQLALLKAIIVVDSDVDVQDVNAVARRVLQTVDWRQDIALVNGMLHPEDFTTQVSGFGAKIGIDATLKLGQSLQPLSKPPRNADVTDVTSIMGDQWRMFAGFIVSKQGQVPLLETAATIWDTWPEYHIVVVDDDLNLDHLSEEAWRILANINWESDVTVGKSGKVLINATTKDHQWPAPLTISPQIKPHRKLRKAKG
ncbi:MAG: UbiD family decarboxylase [Chitinophagaceae bacterium]|nr:UbiD family decarboxylase [Anaerolineae bacterium]